MISWDTPLKRSSDVRSPLTPSSVVSCRCVPAILQINIDWSRGGSECPNKCVWEFRLDSTSVTLNKDVSQIHHTAGDCP